MTKTTDENWNVDNERNFITKRENGQYNVAQNRSMKKNEFLVSYQQPVHAQIEVNNLVLNNDDDENLR